ncbi:MAG: hypothetical protein C3F13_05085 [Anaerolineales bacterium]|nr:MAG: hypothetical protein C3F13_05085 [Anaerolineales bacterium]
MNREQDKLENIWDELLSEQPETIREAYTSLDLPHQQAVLAHLQRMSSESGWQPEQRRSALAALKAIMNQDKKWT